MHAPRTVTAAAAAIIPRAIENALNIHNVRTCLQFCHPLQTQLHKSLCVNGRSMIRCSLSRAALNVQKWGNRKTLSTCIREGRTHDSKGWATPGRLAPDRVLPRWLLTPSKVCFRPKQWPPSLRSWPRLLLPVKYMNNTYASNTEIKD